MSEQHLTEQQRAVKVLVANSTKTTEHITGELDKLKSSVKTARLNLENRLEKNKKE